jgi:hypothetical protein
LLRERLQSIEHEALVDALVRHARDERLVHFLRIACARATSR